MLGTHRGLTEVRLRLLTREQTMVMRLDDRLRVTPEPGALRRPQAPAGARMPDRVTRDRASLRPALVQLVLAVAVLAVIGAVAGVVWEWVWSAPKGVVMDHTWVATDEASLRAQFSGTGWYVVVASAAGLLGGAVVALFVDRFPLVTLLGVVLGSVLAAWLMYRVGVWLGPGDPQTLAHAAKDGTHLPGQLQVDHKSAWTALPAGALVALAMVFLGLSAAHRGADDELVAAADRRDPCARRAHQVVRREPEVQAAPATGHVDTSSSSAVASTTVGCARFCPIGEIPPATYPVARSAAATSAIAALLPPTARASALRSSWPDTGTIPTVSVPSTVAISVLNTHAGSRPSAAAASSPKDCARGSCSYSWTVNAMPARVSATVAGVPPADFFLGTGCLSSHWVSTRPSRPRPSVAGLARPRLATRRARASHAAARLISWATTGCVRPRSPAGRG